MSGLKVFTADELLSESRVLCRVLFISSYPPRNHLKIEINFFKTLSAESQTAPAQFSALNTGRFNSLDTKKK